MRQQWRGKEKINFRVTNPRCDERRKQASREDERMRALQQQADGRTDGQKDGWTKRERKQEAQARTRAQAAGGDGADDHCLPAASSCCGYSSSFTSFKKGGAEAGVQIEIKSMLQNARQSQHNQPQLAS